MGLFSTGANEKPKFGKGTGANKNPTYSFWGTDAKGRSASTPANIAKAKRAETKRIKAEKKAKAAEKRAKAAKKNAPKKKGFFY